MDLSHLLLGDCQVGTPDAQQVRTNRQRSIAEVRVLEAEAICDHLARNGLVDFRHDGLQSDLRVSDVSVVGQCALLLYRRGERFDNGSGVQTAIAVREESAYLTVHRA